MTFALIAVCAIAITIALRKWQQVEMSAARWELYRLRDALRSDLVERVRDGRSTDLHEELDESITGMCSACQARAISLYVFGFAILVGTRDNWDRGKQFMTLLQRPENSTLYAIYGASTMQVLRVLLWRHATLVAILAPTIIGLGLAGAAMYMAAKRMLAMAPIPASARIVAKSTAIPV